MNLRALEQILWARSFEKEAGFLCLWRKFAEEQDEVPPEDAALSEENIDEAVKEFGSWEHYPEESEEESVSDKENLLAYDKGINEKFEKALKDKGILIPFLSNKEKLEKQDANTPGKYEVRQSYQPKTMLGAGKFGRVFQCIFKGAPAAVKIYQYKGDATNDIGVLQQISSIYASLPEHVRRHLPHIYAMGDLVNIGKNDYKYIVMEKMHKLPLQIMEEIYTPQELTDGQYKDLLYRFENSFYGNAHDFNFHTSKKMGDWILGYFYKYVTPKNFSKLPPNLDLQEATVSHIVNDFLASVQGQLVNRELFSKVIGASLREVLSETQYFPASSERSNTDYTGKGLQSLLNALNYLKKFRILYEDMHSANIMLGDDGYLKVSDFGCFDY